MRIKSFPRKVMGRENDDTNSEGTRRVMGLSAVVGGTYQGAAVPKEIS